MVDLRTFNLSGTLSALSLLFRPSQCIPQAVVRNFNDLPLPLSRAFDNDKRFGKVNIRAVVLDKDDCFARPGENEIAPEFKAQFTRLRAAYPHPSMLIVSNTAGTPSMDPDLTSSALLAAATSVPVLAHRTKKPGCSAEIMAYFHSHAELRDLKPEEVAIVGDRLATDVVLANRMGAYAVWVREGVVAKEEKSLFARWEYGIHDWLKKRGVQSPVPGSPFE
ncbi:hypothetical protein VE01_01716 [Pseudogymnoascus verrucosus]|uniref:Phosphatidylglycerophosphatase gep4 mitochondrial n=1 Tax=Pseudogymnoascus verrucosus TaxID=342668 RepID=A0A1B8GW38_9PEZI|nr:uncharacterized protein VE01_01716 [Pseudogymnoascus verrucosus]OBU00029.1 hypothetical protein VE01_01716 [Pseudogymnoascus verrucosus]